jgi:branched-subunit amino acid transport protein
MRIYIYILVMAVTTYLIRSIPLLFMRKPIKSTFLRSFLHYVPVACLTAMTFPAILYTTDHIISGAVGLAIAVLLALRNKSLIVVAAAACCAVFLTDMIITYL